jgi:hypothetical protein
LQGVTYDTGGADIKTGGHMAGMSKDKCGAANIAGFFKTLELLKPARTHFLPLFHPFSFAHNSLFRLCLDLDAYAELGFVRNR